MTGILIELMSIACFTISMFGNSATGEKPLDKKIREMKLLTVRLPDYCPTMASCQRGVHIVCVYDPYFLERLGQKCDGGKNVTLTDDNKQKILALINYIRGRVATGVETGKDNVSLHRAYSMPQLDWDYHLAAFAQILANQCTFKHDMCRATPKFPDPGQAIGLMRFSYPDWRTVEPNGPGEQFDKFADRLEHAIQHIIRRWYRQKANVTNQMISKYPVMSRRQYLRDMSGCSVYLQLISGKSTHIGCGVSAYTDYLHAAKERYYNMIHLVCNFSYKPKLNEFVYDIYNGNDDKCGCEKDIGHSSDCLCHPYYPKRIKEPELETTPEPEQKTTSEPEPETTSEPEPETTPEPDPETTLETDPETTPEPEQKTTPGPESKTTPEPEQETTPESDPQTTLEPDPDTTLEPDPENTLEPAPETTLEPDPETTLEPDLETTREPKTDIPKDDIPYKLTTKLNPGPHTKPEPEPVPLPTLHILPIIVTGNDSDENLVHNNPARSYQSETETVQPMVQVKQTTLDDEYDVVYPQNMSNVETRAVYYDADFEPVNYSEENFDGDSSDFYVEAKDLEMQSGDSNRDQYDIDNNDYTQSDFS